MALDENLPNTHTLFGSIHLAKREYEQSIAFREKAVALDPNDANRKALGGRRMRSLTGVHGIAVLDAIIASAAADGALVAVA
ncbi:MAG: hypothetical protein O7A03_04260 [Alphaproteobacteria bacterium]|nr:hypothetical protein [Alphaproteobacteria bacterium]